MPTWGFARREAWVFIAMATLLLSGPLTTFGRVPPGRAEASSQNGAASGSLPAGSVIWLRLDAPVSTKTSHLHDPVTARVVREVSDGNGIAIPLGTPAAGRIEKLIPSSTPEDRARLLLRFTQLQLPGRPALTFTGHIKEVENARETVLSDGTIQGMLLSEIPVSRLESVIGKIAQDNPDLGPEIEKASKRNLGESDTSISFPAGTDIALTLDAPLAVAADYRPAVPDQLDSGARAAIVQLLGDAPLRAQGKDGKPGDPLNLVVVGSVDEIRRAFGLAGWSVAVQKNEKSIWRTVRAVAGDAGYGEAPVSDLYLYGRPEDLAFEKMLNTFTKRHHLRLWRTGAATPDGREIWLVAATHDTGLDIRPGVASHAIDPDLDDERAKVCADLEVTGSVAARQFFVRSNPLSQGLTATGGTWKTDGRLLAVELKP